MSGGQGEAVHDFVGLHRVGIADAHKDEDVEDAFGRQALSAAVPSGIAMLPHRRPYRAVMFGGGRCFTRSVLRHFLNELASHCESCEIPLQYRRGGRVAEGGGLLIFTHLICPC